MTKGVPILGKDPLGKAKYANVTESGDLRVQLSGQIAANWESVASAVPLVAGETWLSGYYDASDTIKTDVAVRLRDNIYFNVAVNSYGGDGGINWMGTKTIYETESTIAYALMSFENEAPYFQLGITNTYPDDTVITRLYKRQVRHLA